VNLVDRQMRELRAPGTADQDLKAAPETAPPQGGFGCGSIASTGHFRRSRGQSPRLLQSAPQAVP
jgi:hypothetical protein